MISDVKITLSILFSVSPFNIKLLLFLTTKTDASKSSQSMPSWRSVVKDSIEIKTLDSLSKSKAKEFETMPFRASLK